jgi:hypothetical protein
LSAVDVAPPFSGTYFLGVPMTVTAVPAVGFTFAGWSDGSTDPTRTIDAAADVSVVATFQ